MPHPCQLIESAPCGEAAAAILDVHAGRLDAVIVKTVFPAEQVSAVAEQLSADAAELPIFHPPDGRKGLVYGWPLVASEHCFEDYLDMAERFRTACARLFGSAGEPEQTIVRALSSIAGGRPVSVPRADDGRKYLPATIRFLAHGDRLPLHYENEVFGWPGMRHLTPRLDRSTLMSFYIPLVLSDRGGELVLYQSIETGAGRIGALGGDEAARPHLEREGYDILRPDAGDLLVFNGGRRYHEVTRVEGRTRWTMGGVMALSSDERTVHFWS
jgi:hypothetical protein